MSRQLCKDCKYYSESTDYCEQNMFEIEEKIMLDCGDEELEEEWIDECIFYEWNRK